MALYVRSDGKLHPLTPSWRATSPRSQSFMQYFSGFFHRALLLQPSEPLWCIILASGYHRCSFSTRLPRQTLFWLHQLMCPARNVIFHFIYCKRHHHAHRFYYPLTIITRSPKMPQIYVPWSRRYSWFSAWLNEVLPLTFTWWPHQKKQHRKSSNLATYLSLILFAATLTAVDAAGSFISLQPWTPPLHSQGLTPSIPRSKRQSWLCVTLRSNPIVRAAIYVKFHCCFKPPKRKAHLHQFTIPVLMPSYFCVKNYLWLDIYQISNFLFLQSATVQFNITILWNDTLPLWFIGRTSRPHNTVHL